MSAAARLGVACADPLVAASTPAIRPDVAAWLQRELDVAVFLGQAGLPVVAPAAGLPATVQRGGGHVMSFWTYLNRSAVGGRWVWHDFEDTCTGPVAWDIAATTSSPRLDSSRILAAYGDRVDEAQLRTCEQLRRLHLTIWYALYAERLPDCRPRAAELLGMWRER